MNNLLELKGKFNHNKNPNKPGAVTLPKNAQIFPITIDHLMKLEKQLNDIFSYWHTNDLINGALVTVYYREIVAKSNRLGRLLKDQSVNANMNIRGAKFDKTNKKHIFTYFISLNALSKSIAELNKVIVLVHRHFNDKITKDDIDNIKAINIDSLFLLPSTFCQIIKDAFFVEDFGINRDEESITGASIISLYKTGVDTQALLRKLGIDLIEDKMIDDTTIRLNPEELAIIIAKAPYLIAMKTIDLAELKKDDIIETQHGTNVPIPKPGNEPVIGVIDTLFDKSVYFSEWVDYVDMVSDDISKNDEDFYHGTAVTSIIVDGAILNPRLNDGCGRFRVKHFGVAAGGKFSSFSVLKAIRRAVKENLHIKIWNLSLGSSLEVNHNFISPEASELDKIQSEYDVVFVIAGTNRPKNISAPMRIGAPADSINSIVVNSVKFDKMPASYHRVGPVLEFFYKPDLSYYGGEKNDPITVYTNYGQCSTNGTSFAAPWIARKMAYLIQVLGFSREVAKALLIDSAAGWSRKDTDLCDIGYGVVPVHINEIVGSKNDEIKFVFSGATEEYETSAFNIPIPLNNDGKYPYNTRATLCYYPKCSRNQGVDYTNTEIDFQFGRIKENSSGSLLLKSFNGNKQGNIDDITKEINARKNWRKWDNIKHLGNWDKQSNRVKTSYEGELCGVKMTIKERLSSEHETVPFGIVITLKEITGVNRITDFIKRCNIKGWFVNQVDIEHRINIKNIAEEEIKFE